VRPAESLPGWLRTGSKAGLALIITSALVPEFIRRAADGSAQGSAQDPLPPFDPPPSKAHFAFPTPTPTLMEDLMVVIVRRWKARYGQRLDRKQSALLAAQSALTTSFGRTMLNHNVVGRRADRFWPGAWTVRREPEWKNGRPLYRWAPIRAFASLDLGVHDWLSELPDAAIDAVHADDLRAFAAALIEAGWASTTVEVYEPELSVTRGRVLAGEIPKGPAQPLGPVPTFRV
jgi:hypothetical protein